MSDRSPLTVTLDLRSVLVGVGLAAIAFVGLGASDDDDAEPRVRYQMSAYGTDNLSGVYVLEPATGRLWHRGAPINPALSRIYGLGTVDKPRLDEISLTN